MSTLPKYGKIDRLLNKTISRKLLVFLTSTGLLISNRIDGSEWVLMACIYIGVQGAIDFFKVKYNNN
jgi:hypothetical protein